MARRTYLQRIAVPLAAGDPVLFAVPRPAAEEARPSATPRALTAPLAPPVPTTPAPTPMVRRRPVETARQGAGTPALPGKRATPAAFAAAETRNSAPAAILPAKLAASSGTDEPATTADPPGNAVARGHQVGPHAEPAFVLSSQTPRITSPGGDDVAPAPPAQSFRVRPDHAEPPVAQAARAPERSQNVTDAPRQGGAEGPAEMARQILPSWQGDRVPPNLSSLPATKPSEPAPPRIHIGTIEVRTTAPTVPPPPMPAAPPTLPRIAADRTAPTPPRDYGWRFGLIQG